MTVHPNISAAERQAGAQSRLSLRVNLRRGRANRRFQFHERRHLFDCSRNETFFVVAMRHPAAPSLRPSGNTDTREFGLAAR